MRIAVVDIGTNSTRLLISENLPGQDKPEIKGTWLITSRLGEGVGKNKYLTEAAMERTLDALNQFRRIIEENKVKRVVAAATSAVRDASNQSRFLEQVKEQVGFDIRVLSGVEEANLSYQGVVHGLKKVYARPVVIDIGGGSTEFIWQGSKGLFCESLQVGAVRMTENNAGMHDIRLAVQNVTTTVKAGGYSELIGVGGTITTLAAVDQELDIYNPEKVHGYFLTREKITNILERFEGMTVEQRKHVPGLQAQRADIIVSGVRIVLAILEGLDMRGITVSETDIMYGLLYEVFGQDNFCSTI